MRTQLSPNSIERDTFRAALYRDIKAGGLEFKSREILESEEWLPELIAAKEYGNPDLRWVVSIAASQDDEGVPLVVGRVIQLPPVLWLRDRIRFYQEKERKRFVSSE